MSDSLQASIDAGLLVFMDTHEQQYDELESLFVEWISQSFSQAGFYDKERLLDLHSEELVTRFLQGEEHALAPEIREASRCKQRVACCKALVKELQVQEREYNVARPEHSKRNSYQAIVTMLKPFARDYARYTKQDVLALFVKHVADCERWLEAKQEEIARLRTWSKREAWLELASYYEEGSTMPVGGGVTIGSSKYENGEDWWVSSISSYGGGRYALPFPKSVDTFDALATWIFILYEKDLQVARETLALLEDRLP